MPISQAALKKAAAGTRSITSFFKSSVSSIVSMPPPLVTKSLPSTSTTAFTAPPQSDDSSSTSTSSVTPQPDDDLSQPLKPTPLPQSDDSSPASTSSASSQLDGIFKQSASASLPFPAPNVPNNPLKRPHSSTEKIHLFGKVTLDHPDHFDEAQWKDFQKLLRDFKHFENRGLVPSPSEYKAVDEIFVEFSTAETQLSGLDPKHLVRPSGPVSAALINHAHYPSFASENIQNGQVYDTSNPSMELLASTGMNDKNVFWFDGFCRRTRRKFNVRAKKAIPFKAEKHYSPALITLYRKQVRDISAQLHAKVEIIYGRAERERYLKEQGSIRAVPLWGEYEGLEIHIVRSAFPKVGPIERIVLFSHHPEYFFHNWPYAVGLGMDRLLNLAFELASLDLQTTAFTDRSVKVGYLPTHLPSFPKSITERKDKRVRNRPSKAKPKDQLDYGNILQKVGKLEIKGDMVFTWEELPPVITTWAKETVGIESESDIWQFVYGSIENQRQIAKIINGLPKLKSGINKGMPVKRGLPDKYPQYFLRGSGCFKLGYSVRDVAEEEGISDKVQMYFEEKDRYLAKVRAAGRDLLMCALNSIRSQHFNSIRVEKEASRGNTSKVRKNKKQQENFDEEEDLEDSEGSYHI